MGSGRQSDLTSIINAVRYKPPNTQDEEVNWQNAVKKIDNNSKSDCHKCCTVPNDYIVHRNTLLSRLEQIESM